MSRIFISMLHVQKKASAQSTLDQVFRRLGIVEKDYFGFEFEDDLKNCVCFVAIFVLLDMFFMFGVCVMVSLVKLL